MAQRGQRDKKQQVDYMKVNTYIYIIQYIVRNITFAVVSQTTAQLWALQGNNERKVIGYSRNTNIFWP